jgi:hypothetical protein
MTMATSDPNAPWNNGTTAQIDAVGYINTALSEYGLGDMSNWLYGQVTSNASTDQIMQDLYQTPQFATRFPGIIARQKAGLPPISPTDYIDYENKAKQMENQYNLPHGLITDPNRLGQLIGTDVGFSELADRVQNGYQQVAFAPPDVRQAFTAMFGVSGDGALAAHFLDTTHASKLLTEQATAATLAGTFGMGGVNMGADTAMQLAQQGVSPAGGGTTLAELQKTAPIYNANINETNNLQVGDQGVKAAFGLDATSAQQVLQREQERAANFAGGGRASGDQYGTQGAGAARPM